MQVISNNNILRKKYRIYEYAEIDSTFSAAERLLKKDTNEDSLIMADSQTAGYGKLDRQWASPPGNLYLTIIKYGNIPIKDAPKISLIMSLSIIELLKAELPSTKNINFKWPNDVLVDGKKISGVLLKGFSESNQNEIANLMIGIGLNILSSPQNLAYKTTSVKENSETVHHREYYIEKLVTIFDEMLDRWRIEGFSFVQDDLEKSAYGLGNKITIKQTDKEISGIFKNIDNNGNLVTIAENGELRLISSGDVLLKTW